MSHIAVHGPASMERVLVMLSLDGALWEEYAHFVDAAELPDATWASERLKPGDLLARPEPAKTVRFARVRWSATGPFGGEHRYIASFLDCRPDVRRCVDLQDRHGPCAGAGGRLLL